MISQDSPTAESRSGSKLRDYIENVLLTVLLILIKKS